VYPGYTPTANNFVVFTNTGVYCGANTTTTTSTSTSTSTSTTSTSTSTSTTTLPPTSTTTTTVGPNPGFVTSGLIGLYLSESYNSSSNILYDWSGNGNNATVIGSTLTSFSSSAYGLKFDGNTYIQFPAGITGSGGTIEFVGQVFTTYTDASSSVSSSIYRQLFTKHNIVSGSERVGYNEYVQKFFTGTNVPFTLEMQGVGGPGAARINYTGSVTGAIQFISVASPGLSTSPFSGSVANASTSSLTIYSTGSVGFPSGSIFYTSSANLKFGSASIDGQIKPYDGTFRYIMVYNRALTNSEVIANYNAISASLKI
jgi:hypothetical protein